MRLGVRLSAVTGPRIWRPTGLRAGSVPVAFGLGGRREVRRVVQRWRRVALRWVRVLSEALWRVVHCPQRHRQGHNPADAGPAEKNVDHGDGAEVTDFPCSRNYERHEVEQRARYQDQKPWDGISAVAVPCRKKNVVHASTLSPSVSANFRFGSLACLRPF